MPNDEDDWLPDDEEMEEFLAEWDRADAEAAEILEEACAVELVSPPARGAVEKPVSRLRAGVAEGSWPWDYFVNACGWPDGMLEDDPHAWVAAVAASISPPDDPKTEPEVQSAIAALMHADWLGLVVGLVRRGVGAEFSAEAALNDIDTLPELEGELDDKEGLLDVLEMAVEGLAPLWGPLGILDEDRRLTELGRWGLPTGLLVTWSGPRVRDDGAGERGRGPGGRAR